MDGGTLGLEIREVLAAVLARPIAPNDPVERVDIPDWDSLKHVEVVFALEGALGVRFDAGEIGYLSNVEAIAAAVERHRAA